MPTTNEPRSITIFEKTRCDVDEPMSTPTLVRIISSSESSVRDWPEKNVVGIELNQLTCDAVRAKALQRRNIVRGLVEHSFHPRLGAFLLQQAFIFVANKRILHPVRNRRTTLVQVHSRVIDVC